MIRIALVEDHTLFRQSIVKTLSAENDMDVVGEAGRGDDAQSLVERGRPDVLVLDLALPGEDGVEVALRIKRAHPATRVLFLTMHDDEHSIRRAMSSGADGFVPKTATSDEFLQAVRIVAAGDSYLSPTVARRVVNIVSGRAASTAARLSDRDLELLRLLADGLRPAEVAARLFLSTKTVKNYCSRIYAELGVRTATQAVVEAYRRGLLAPPAPR